MCRKKLISNYKDTRRNKLGIIFGLNAMYVAFILVLGCHFRWTSTMHKNVINNRRMFVLACFPVRYLIHLGTAVQVGLYLFD